MNRILTTVLTLMVFAPAAAVAQEGQSVSKAVNLGPLADSFTLVSALAYADDDGYRIVLKLQAKKDVDTTDLSCQAGFFDREKHVLHASPLQFQVLFPMQKGETVSAGFNYLGESDNGSFPWHTIVIRPKRGN
jgi:hypothetical protein